jgi:alpha-tubulin suppressor-like RCC1 family protein
MHKIYHQRNFAKGFFIVAATLTAFINIRVQAQCAYFTTVNTSATATHCLGIKSDGTLWAWGNNQSGQLGDGNTGTVVSEPEQIGTGTNWKVIAAGNEHSLALTADGKLWAWGDDGEGELGDGAPVGVARNVPTPEHITSPDSIWIAVGACEAHSVGVTADGKLWAWGYGTLLSSAGTIT